MSARRLLRELRRRAIYNNYRALVDISTAGGYGVLYGPNVPVEGGAPNTTPGAGKIAGTEYLAYSVDATGKAAATLMVQIPSTFSQTAPCIVTATSSGSRGVYGAVSAAGEWDSSAAAPLPIPIKARATAHTNSTQTRSR